MRCIYVRSSRESGETMSCLSEYEKARVAFWENVFVAAIRLGHSPDKSREIADNSLRHRNRKFR